MKTDLIKILLFSWMVGTAYMIYLLYTDVTYITELVHLYMKLAMEHKGY